MVGMEQTVRKQMAGEKEKVCSYSSCPRGPETPIAPCSLSETFEPTGQRAAYEVP